MSTLMVHSELAEKFNIGCVSTRWRFNGESSLNLMLANGFLELFGVSFSYVMSESLSHL